MSMFYDEQNPRGDIDCGTESMTHQSFRDECDINVIMRRWNNNGQLPQLNERTPDYGDFSNVMEYLDALKAVDQAATDFQALPSAVREACGNDPARFIAICQDSSPEGVQRLRELGLTEEQETISPPPQEGESIPAEPVQTPTPASEES